jgi:hypothetical protein
VQRASRRLYHVVRLDQENKILLWRFIAASLPYSHSIVLGGFELMS